MIFVDLFYQLGKLLLLCPKHFIFLLLLDIILDLFLEDAVALSLLHLMHDLFNCVCQLDLVQLYQFLVASDIWIILQLTAQVVSLPLQIIRDSQYFFLSLLELVLLTDTFELAPARYQVGILDF